MNKGKKTRAEKPSEQKCWFEPQFHTPLGRVELSCFCPRDTVRVRRAGGPDLKSHRRLTQHHDQIDIKRDPETGKLTLAETYRNHDRRIADILLQAVAAWAADNDDLLRRCLAFDHEWMGMRGPSIALSERAEQLSAKIKAGVFDFGDGDRHAPAVAAKAVKRLHQVIHDLNVMEHEIRQAIIPSTEQKRAA
jgi:hypothetical protein